MSLDAINILINKNKLQFNTFNLIIKFYTVTKYIRTEHRNKSKNMVPTFKGFKLHKAEQTVTTLYTKEKF